MQPTHPNMDCRMARGEEMKKSIDFVLCSDDFSSVWNSRMICEWIEKVVEQSGSIVLSDITLALAWKKREKHAKIC